LPRQYCRSTFSYQVLSVTESPTEKLLLLTSQIVSAHVGHNNVAADALPNLIHSVYQSLAGVGQSQPPQPA
jgi:predicted transcriptional regulator